MGTKTKRKKRLRPRGWRSAHWNWIRSDPRVLANVGVTLWWGLGRYEEGASFIDQALEIDPNYALAWSFGGGARLRLGRFDEAIKYCELALRLSPLDPRAFIPANVMAHEAYFPFWAV